MALETKPVAKLKTGIWVNRIKMRRALNRFSLFYGIILAGFGVFNIMGGSYFEGIFQLVLALPLGLIQWSYTKFEKAETKERLENEGK